MRNVFAVAVFVSCVLGFGHAYKCYTCTMATQDQNCLQTTNCSSETPYCGTSVTNLFFLNVVSKYCSAICVSSTQNFTVVSSIETCCEGDLCNDIKIGDNISFGSGASGVAGSALLTLTAAGLLGFVLGI